ncbi:MAG: UDP-N-acetylglucosamine 1-carboxyvinyltransferase, partial [Planctomycetes bacterium]|nr:UDP-N-acetylglucosamine 1-carboxyvinyltransferase [Planctomycetota bacterium]
VVHGANPMHLLAVVDRLQAAGAQLDVGKDSIRNVPTATGRLRACDVTTMPYPGFPTDLQAQFMALMARADGVSVITEKIYPERFIHAAELQRLGARIRREGPSAIIEGTDDLRGAPVMASDLRASASLVLAGLVARGHTDVRRVYHIDRGYERIEQKLHGIGADIERISEG